MMLIENGILLKYKVSCLLKNNINITPQSQSVKIYENFKPIFFTYLVQTKIWKLVQL